MKIKITDNGPYEVTGNVPLAEQLIVSDKDGEALTWREGKVFQRRDEYYLCRCGKSEAKPYCDGTHLLKRFDGVETASREPFSAQADPKTAGPDLELTDVPSLCAGAGFCSRAGGTWTNTERSGDPEARKIAVQEACDCPAGRLVASDRTGKAIEPDLPPSIGIVREENSGGEGPIWVRGGIPIEAADGYAYEVRNRVTLCRCGRSSNKPFCDGKHLD